MSVSFCKRKNQTQASDIRSLLPDFHGAAHQSRLGTSSRRRI
jgi:hypothetical protein